MVKRFVIRIYTKRIKRMVITSIPKLIYTWRLGMQIIIKWGRVHKRFTSIFILPLARSYGLKQISHIINIERT